MKELIWNVYVYGHNCNEIYVHNVFDHWRFMEDLVKLKKHIQNKFRNIVTLDDTAYALFSAKVKGLLFYYYSSKYEWETIITSFGPYITEKELHRLNLERVKDIDSGRDRKIFDVNLMVEQKIDVYIQIMMNWDHFINYLWNNRKLIKPKQPKFEKTDPSEPNFL